MLNNLHKYKIYLASKSPRRREMLTNLGITYHLCESDFDESYPTTLAIEKVAEYISIEKNRAIDIDSLSSNALIITSDTTVCINGSILGKPANQSEAFAMLKLLSGKTHQVISGLCIRSREKTVATSSTTDVTFKALSDEEINYYIDHYQPFDKAGGYGIQEWIGFIAVERISGSYFNVVGLPVHLLYTKLQLF